MSRMMILNPDLHFWNIDLKIHFWTNLDPKIQSCVRCLKIGGHSISVMLIANPELHFLNSHTKIHLRVNLDTKVQNSPFCLQIGAHSISRMLIPYPDLKFRNSNPKSILGQIYVQKFKVVRFFSKLVHILSKGCWFRI